MEGGRNVGRNGPSALETCNTVEEPRHGGDRACLFVQDREMAARDPEECAQPSGSLSHDLERVGKLGKFVVDVAQELRGRRAPLAVRDVDGYADQRNYAAVMAEHRRPRRQIVPRAAVMLDQLLELLSAAGLDNLAVIGDDPAHLGTIAMNLGQGFAQHLGRALAHRLQGRGIGRGVPALAVPYIDERRRRIADGLGEHGCLAQSRFLLLAFGDVAPAIDRADQLSRRVTDRDHIDRALNATAVGPLDDPFLVPDGFAKPTCPVERKLLRCSRRDAVQMKDPKLFGLFLERDLQ